MKPSLAITAIVCAVLATIVIEESRISKLRAEIIRLQAIPTDASPGDTTATSSPDLADGSQAPPKIRPRELAAEQATAPADDDPLGKNFRKMWDNPAGRAIMSQGQRAAIAGMYADLAQSFDLSDEEEDYFYDLLAKRMADQQELGMKLMSAGPDERADLTAETSKREQAFEEDIKTFLNHEEDFAEFKDWEDRAPERNQVSGLRAAMATTETPLDPVTEKELLDAMYKARTESNATNFKGPAGLDAIAAGTAAETFESDWQAQQEILDKRVSPLLDEPQMEAFRSYQEQMKEFQLMGIKMAEKMIRGE